MHYNPLKEFIRSKLLGLDTSEMKRPKEGDVWGTPEDEMLSYLIFDPETGFFSRKDTGKRTGIRGVKYRKITLRSRIFGNRTFTIHRLAWRAVHGPIPPGLEIDHINGNSLDCRIVNLRLATTSQNHQNCRRPKSNTSGFKGVSWLESAKKWRATICHQSKQHDLGLFDTPEKAHQAYVEAGKRLHGEFARAS